MNTDRFSQISWHKRVILALLLSLTFGIWMKPAEAATYVTADSAVVIDALTGQVLYGKNMHVRRPPASTTKIVTTILALELGNLQDKVTASKRAASQEGSSIWLTTGEVLTLEEMLYGIMLSSGNDASVAVAEYIAGSVEEFAVLMNRKSQEIGALNSTFKNPNGLPHNEHLTTAYDLAMIMRYGMQNPMFRKLNATQVKEISWPGNTWNRVLHNHNKLLKMYEGCDGGKTGYTKAAGRCLISTATRNGRRVITIVLHADALWEDSTTLLDYGLDQFTNITLFKAGEVVHVAEFAGSREKELQLMSARDFVVTIPRGQESKVTKTIHLRENLQVPIMKGEKVGNMEISLNGEKVGQLDLIAKEDLTEVSLVHRFWRWISSIVRTFV